MGAASSEKILSSVAAQLRTVRSLKDEAISGLCVWRYIVWFGLNCQVLHDKETDMIHGTSEIHLRLPLNAQYLTFHCDQSYLQITEVFLQATGEKHDSENILSSSRQIDECWKVPESHILLDCGPDKTTGIMVLPNLQQFEAKAKNASRNGDNVDWDECSTTESLDHVAPADTDTCNVSIFFYFRARVNTLPEGLYLAQGIGENDVDDTSESILATALEQLFARRVFPCLDIAQYKASFRLRCAISNPCSQHIGADVLSTTIIELRRHATDEETQQLCQHLLPLLTTDDTCDLVFFKETVSLPPYSASLFYGMFEHLSCIVSARREEPEQTRVDTLIQCSVPIMLSNRSRLHECIFAHKWAVKVFQFLADTVFFNIEKRIDKLTLIPLRCQRGLGLENHGCITFKEDFFLIPDPLLVPILKVIRIHRLVCHEICHQWIGNLFTPHEITDIWLKEGFVRYVEFLIVDVLLDCSLTRHLMWVSFLFDVKVEAIVVDAYSFTHDDDLSQCNALGHPVQNAEPCTTLASLTKLFDSITYDKTASILMMWDTVFAGNPLFSDGSYPSFYRSTFLPALVATFQEAEQNGISLFESNSIWKFADEERRQKNLVSAWSRLPSGLSVVSNLPIALTTDFSTANLLDPWLNHLGFPCVMWEGEQVKCPKKRGMRTMPYCDQDNNHLYWKFRISQMSKTKHSEALWIIPLAFRLVADKHSGVEEIFLPFLLTTREQEFEICCHNEFRSIVRMVDEL
eukprot:Gregarina_sp_Poly_1__4106@NODE_2252_length_2404_cov_128_729140_g760_i1_p1_GENE_NODE_2252_length_2404_cov_128_729140_g760_i1NODE_2252_length_2404_cov_128_729140_g760_i1_p1_ORF_typecomplete_len745_score80_62Peptidase_M1/PF01433_20/6_9e26Peptidase_M1_N/PF17900_1/1_9e08Peptidase_M61/PF05299_12/0_042DUF1570/PF07607_11/0_072Peptidase_MA_2/PF13485_6/0_099Peptidase_MA_2/PF13485_6/6_1e03_NODE_2252_length_2404_cov_128_729140_g760_i1882322